MRRAWPVLAGAALCAGLLPRPAPAIEGDYEAVVTRIPVKLTDRLSSQDDKPGDRFHFDTTSSVIVDALFLPAGTHGRGSVLGVRPGRGPQPGALELSADSLDLPDGKKLAVGLAPGELAVELHGDYRQAPVGVNGAPVFLGPLRTTNVIYEKGTRFIVEAPPQPTPAPGESPAG